MMRRFDFASHGHACRRDAGAQPRNLLLGFKSSMRVIEFHSAGTEFVDERPVDGILGNSEFIAGFSPQDAARIGAAVERIAHDGLDDASAPASRASPKTAGRALARIREKLSRK